MVDEVGRAQSGDAGRQVEQGAGNPAGAQIGLVGLGDGDQQIGIVGAGFLEHRGRGGVAADGAQIEAVAQGGQMVGIGVDHGDVVGFRDQIFGHRSADLSCAEKNDFHVSSR